MSDLADEFDKSLRRNDEALRTWLRAVLAERNFPPHPRFRGEPAPMTPDDALVGILIEFDVQSLHPVAIGLSRAAAWKRGARVMKPVDEELIQDELMHAAMESVEFDSFARRYVHWVGAAWRDVRRCAPDLRGFLSPHDSLFWQDLDGDLDGDRAIDSRSLGLGMR
jgi:hypothetical protein